MKNYRLLLPLSFLLLCNMVSGQALLHYWNFNDNSSINALLAPQTSVINGASITHQAGGISAIDVAGGTGQGFDLENLNARNGDPSGTHLRFNDPIGGSLDFALPTTGHTHIVVKFSTRRSGSGAGRQFWFYTTDGANYTLFDSLEISAVGPELKTLDFSAITAANNNPLFGLRVSFAQGTGGLVGNNRFDNFTIEEQLPDLSGRVTGVTLDKRELFLQVGGEENLVATVLPADANDKSVTWSSSDNNIASVDNNGKVSAIGGGTAKIWVTTTDGDFKDSCIVNVSIPSNLDLIYYWHFNNLSTPEDVRVITADYSLINNANAKLTYTLTPDPNIVNERDIDRFSPGTMLNIQQSQTAGGAARVRNPSVNRSLVFDIPTVGVKDIQFSYAIQRSGNGMLSNTIQYSINGTDFITTGLQNNVQTVEGAEIWQVFTYDFSGLVGVDNNPLFKIRIIWEDANASNLSGNNRYDNIAVMGKNVNASLATAPTKLNVSVYPNPAQDHLIVSYNAGQSLSFIHIIDSQGKVVAEGTDSHIDISSLSNGLYFVITNVEGRTYRNKLQVIR